MADTTLDAACECFLQSDSDVSLATSAASLIFAAQICVKSGVSDGAGPNIVRAIRLARRAALAHAENEARGWETCDALPLIETGPWHSLHLLLFICQCHLRTCLVRLYTDNEETWSEAWGVPGVEDGEETREELEKGIEASGVARVLREKPFRRTAAALVVCLEGMVDITAGDDDALLSDGRPSRRAVRLLERRSLHEDADARLAEILGGLVLEDNCEPLMTLSDNVNAWLERAVKMDANNTTLLRMDEWAITCALTSEDVAFAVGERGAVPQEHRNTPSAWVAQQSLADDAYQRLMKDAKINENHVENVYVAFAEMLKQHYSFNWFTRCFVARLNPVHTLRKVNEFLRAAGPRTPPLVVQRGDQVATLLIWTSLAIQRVECPSPGHALSAWMMAVRRHAGGVYSRRGDVKDLIERIENAPQVHVALVPQDIGGASIRIGDAEP
jgi:hypothetical protein